MGIDFRTSLVYILDPDSTSKIDKRTLGTGFVASADGLLITCAHVITALQSDTLVPLIFFDPTKTKEQREIRTARILPEYVRSPEAEDVAVLRLEGPLPGTANPLPLGSAHVDRSQSIQTFGFSQTQPEDGLFGECRIFGRTSDSSFPVLQISSQQVSRGFSGAPLWDEQRQCVVGIVKSIVGTRRLKVSGSTIAFPFDIDWRQMETGFATPSDVLQQVCPLLTMSEECPYRGLQSFTEEHARFFFGQERTVDRLVNRLRRELRFLPVFGPSGSGKSSIVRAGLIPRLRQGELADSEHWDFVVMRPADDPFEQCSASGLTIDNQDLKEAVKHWFVEHGQGQQESRLVLVVDQFEEVFAPSPEGKYQTFIEQLKILLGSPLNVTLILIMRDDFYNYFVKDRGLSEWLEYSQGPFNISPRLTAPEITAIVRKPAEAVRLRLEDGLVEMIVKDTLETMPSQSDEGPVVHSTMLPLLEFTLTQLWERRIDSVMKRDEYTRIGGVTGGLTKWADDVLSDLEEKDKVLEQEARRVLTSLVLVGDERQAIPDRRRRLPMSSLSIESVKPEVTHALVQRLTNAKLLITDYDVHGKQEMVEIIHEALLREWNRMRQWLQKDRAFLLWQQELERRMQAWSKTNLQKPNRREKEKLLHGSELREAMDWLQQRRNSLTLDEQLFIQASWRMKQRRLVTNVLGGTVLAGAALSGGAWWLLEQVKPYIDVATYTGHSKAVHCVAWSPEGTRLASGSVDRTVQVYFSHGEKIYTYLGHTETVSAVAWSPDGYRVASASGDTTAHVWSSDGKGTQPVLIYRGHHAMILSLAWSPNGNALASGSGAPEHLVHVWDATTSRLLYRYQDHTQPINGLAWSPDSTRIASASGDSTVQIWDAFTGKRRVTYTGHQAPTHVLSVAWSPDGRYIASAGYEGAVHVWSAKTGNTFTVYRGHNNRPVTHVAWSPDSTYVASASSDKTVQVWKALDGTLSCTYNEHAGEVECVSWSHASNILTEALIASCGIDKIVRIWKLK